MKNYKVEVNLDKVFDLSALKLDNVEDLIVCAEENSDYDELFNAIINWVIDHEVVDGGDVTVSLYDDERIVSGGVIRNFELVYSF